MTDASSSKGPSPAQQGQRLAPLQMHRIRRQRPHNKKKYFEMESIMMAGNVFVISASVLFAGNSFAIFARVLLDNGFVVIVYTCSGIASVLVVGATSSSTRRAPTPTWLVASLRSAARDGRAEFPAMQACMAEGPAPPEWGLHRPRPLRLVSSFSVSSWSPRVATRRSTSTRASRRSTSFLYSFTVGSVVGSYSVACYMYRGICALPPSLVC